MSHCCSHLHPGQPPHFQFDPIKKPDAADPTLENTLQYPANIEKPSGSSLEQIKLPEDMIKILEDEINPRQHNWILRYLGQLYISNKPKIQVKD